MSLTKIFSLFFALGESIWSRPYGPVAQALYTEIPEDDTVSRTVVPSFCCLFDFKP